MDISGSMRGERLRKVKRDTTELLNSLLSDSKNQAALITFSSSSEILFPFTNDVDILLNTVDNLKERGTTNCYQALVNVDTILKEYTLKDDKDCIVLFLTDGYPNVNVPNEVGQYQYLKEEYPYLVINGIQYEMGNDVLRSIKNVSYNQFIAEFILTDYIDTNYFYVEDAKDIKASQGRIEFDKEEQKITWNIDSLRTGENAQMVIDVQLKEEFSGLGGLYPTNKKEKVHSDINGVIEDIKSDETPVLNERYSVIYEGNAQMGVQYQ